MKIKINWPMVLACIAFALLGFTVGWLTGLSRAPAVSSLLSSILTFAGLFVAYLFSKESTSSLWLASTLLLFFLPSLLLGSFSSTNFRSQWEEYRMDLDDWYKRGLARFQVDLEVYKYEQQELIKIRLGHNTKESKTPK